LISFQHIHAFKAFFVVKKSWWKFCSRGRGCDYKIWTGIIVAIFCTNRALSFFPSVSLSLFLSLFYEKLIDLVPSELNYFGFGII
jgi:hypothetical protein